MPEQCLQQLTGSCLGCDVLEIARNRIARDGTNYLEAATSVGMELCPSGAQMQNDHLKLASQSGWCQWGWEDMGDQHPPGK